MEILGFIPARGGSKGIPRKNITPLNKKPLIEYSIEAALKSKITRTIVSTDDNEIAEISQKAGAEVPFLRSDELASDEATVPAVLKDLILELVKVNDYAAEVIVLLHPTTPLRTAKHIDESIDLLIQSDADMVVSVSEPIEHPADMVYWAHEKEMKFLIEDTAYLQRQDYNKCWFLNGAIYTFKTESYLRKGWMEGDVIPYEMSSLDSIDIDTPEDLKIAELLLKDRTKKKVGRPTKK